jgi:hypothetical protein
MEEQLSEHDNKKTRKNNFLNELSDKKYDGKNSYKNDQRRIDK